MTPIPSPVKNVRVYPYIPDAPIIVQPVFVSGAGTYSVGTLGTNVFYNLNLTSGEAQNGGVHAGAKYYAIGQDQEGKEFTTTWLTCTQGGNQPQFGRTVHFGPHKVGAQAENHANLAYSVHLSDVAVNVFVPPFEPLAIPLIENGKGIATFAGLLPGGSWTVSVTDGTRVNPLQDGTVVTISATNVATGKPFHIPATFVTRDSGEPAVFVERRILDEQ
ncbi:hypothetical protein [Chromobacterium alticapitis]|uniref:Uncharacterized protein n=1 Tax=Chromobacterium alticapitis TaxID=2073169 RepID=A0A2S5DC99_9NEIS|nr:hypothetical protein [Chromobacterium alticapitis]POZ60622.1 hypothetical protein C2I19_17935 [Chromobacterium alticapitis]